jgi:hypothetical protein
MTTMAKTPKRRKYLNTDKLKKTPSLPQIKKGRKRRNAKIAGQMELPVITGRKTIKKTAGRTGVTVKEVINSAIVTLPKYGGHGVLVRSGIILTAAHCCDHTTSGGMVLGDHHLQEIESHTGKIMASPMFIEPITDIAALGCPDDQAFPGYAETFEKFCEMTKPIPLSRRHIRCRIPFAVLVYDKDGTWIKGTAEMIDEFSPMLSVTTDREIEGGASGGPILNLARELVAIISNSSSPVEGKSVGRCPRPWKTLAGWICDELDRF